MQSVIELGANIGLNLIALGHLLPNAHLTAVEINTKAANALHALEGVEVYGQSILDFDEERKWDLILTKGVLIHINPDKLRQVYDLMYKLSGKYICMAEYYNPSPVSIPYRDNSDRLFKRDFAGDMLDRFSDLSLVDYGFVYHRDRIFPQDDLTWFLLEKA